MARKLEGREGGGGVDESDMAAHDGPNSNGETMEGWGLLRYRPGSFLSLTGCCLTVSVCGLNGITGLARTSWWANWGRHSSLDDSARFPDPRY